MKKSFNNVWEDIHKNQEWGKYPPEHIVRFIARNYYNSKREDIKILDFGCGAGANTWFLAREGFDVYAFDGSASAVEKTREYLNKNGVTANLEVKDALQLSYNNDFFDCVIDSACICCNELSDKKIMYKEVYDILKCGGKLISTCFTSNTTRELPLGTTFFDNKDEVTKILSEIGFKNIIIDVDTCTDNGCIVEWFIIKCEK